MITGLDHIHVIAKDLDESIRFYTDVLGFYFLRRIAHPGSHETAYVGLGEVLLELVPPAPGQEQGRAPLALRVTGLDETLADLRGKGIEILSDNPGRTFYGRQATVRDPSGFVIELREWQAPDNHRYPDWQPTGADTSRIA